MDLKKLLSDLVLTLWGLLTIVLGAIMLLGDYIREILQ